jgi:3-methyladenine DNA glycosylase AlkD
MSRLRKSEGARSIALSASKPRLNRQRLRKTRSLFPPMPNAGPAPSGGSSAGTFHETGVVARMGELYAGTEESNRAGVSALAEEIDERLSNMPGAATDALREVRCEFSRRLKDAAPHVVIELAALLLEVRKIEYRFIAYELIHHHPSALSHLTAWQLEQLGRGIASWAAVDCFGIYLAGPVWRERHVPNTLIHGWARSADRWWRRAALVSTVPLNSKAQGGAGDAYRTLQVCRLLERDRDPMVAKALSWALRELAKQDPRAVREYVGRRKDVLPALVLREVNNKLATGMKNPKARSAAKRKSRSHDS